MSQYIDSYGVESLHGRGIPFATGVKLANPELTVISLSGDGDSYGIGIGHVIHAARRNIPLLHITCDNQNYALTTGQASVTTPEGKETKTTPEGNFLPPLDPVKMLETMGCGFATQVQDKDLPTLKETIKTALQHQGFSHINVNQSCPTWRKR